MISIEQASEIILGQEVEPVPIEVSLEEARGYYLAEEITSPFDLPTFDNSAMDGYAVCGESSTYRIVGEVAAGEGEKYDLSPGEAVRIFTGARVPENTTAVIMQEKTRVDGAVLYVDVSVDRGSNIRRRGNELSLGEPVFSPGHYLSPASVGQIGSLGMDKVKVYRKPDIRIISTGDELVPPGSEKKEGQIYESNSYALKAVLEQYGFACRERTHIRDDFEAIKKGIAGYLDRSDVLLLSGGISVGDYDFVKQALEENGVEELFYKVYQKPGKPLFFGRKGDKFVFALPGNPASSLTCFFIHVLPLLQKMSGSDGPGLKRIRVPLKHSYKNTSDRPIFLKAKVEDQTVSILNRQSSSMIHSMAMGNALVFFEEPGKVPKGERVTTLLI